MEEHSTINPPSQCPVCQSRLAITRLECVSCGTEVTGAFSLGRLETTPEPHASLLEMFLRVRGNVKEMERELGLSYPTVRARLDEAFEAAGYGRSNDRSDTTGAGFSLGPDLSERILRKVHEGLAGVEHDLAQAYVRAGMQRERPEDALAEERRRVLDGLESGEITAQEAAGKLRELKGRRSR